MSTRLVPYVPGTPLVWSRPLKVNGKMVQAGDPVDSAIGAHKLSALYGARKVDLAAAAPLEPVRAPAAIPKGSSLLDDLSIEEAEKVLSAAMGELSAEDWNALSPDARDELVLAAVPERENSAAGGEEAPLEGAGAPERE